MLDSAKTAVRIIEYAKKQGISQKYICEQLGLSRTYILDSKNGKAKITPDRLEVIAELLHTTPAYLMDETDDPAPIKKESPTEELLPEQQAIIDKARNIKDPQALRAINALLEEILNK